MPKFWEALRLALDGIRLAWIAPATFLIYRSAVVYTIPIKTRITAAIVGTILFLLALPVVGRMTRDMVAIIRDLRRARNT